MIEYKRFQIIKYVAIAIAIVLVSISGTLLLAKLYGTGFGTSAETTRRGLGIVEKRPKLDLYAGHEVCNQAIRKEIDGTIITLNLDPRAAKYNEFDRTNTLMFLADVKMVEEKFLSEQRSTIAMQILCTTSADDNSLLSVTVTLADQR